jgi:hypothetical protein
LAFAKSPVSPVSAWKQPPRVSCLVLGFTSPELAENWRALRLTVSQVPLVQSDIRRTPRCRRGDCVRLYWAKLVICQGRDQTTVHLNLPGHVHLGLSFRGSGVGEPAPATDRRAPPATGAAAASERARVHPAS